MRKSLYSVGDFVYVSRWNAYGEITEVLPSGNRYLYVVSTEDGRELYGHFMSKVPA